MTMQIKGAAVGGRIEAGNIAAKAMQHPEMIALGPALKAAGLDNLRRPITPNELNAKLSASRLTVGQKIAVKSAFDRHDMIDDGRIIAAADDGDEVGVHPALREVWADLRSLGLDKHVMAGGGISTFDLAQLFDQAVKDGKERFREPARRIRIKHALDAAGLLRPHKFV